MRGIKKPHGVTNQSPNPEIKRTKRMRGVSWIEATRDIDAFNVELNKLPKTPAYGKNKASHNTYYSPVKVQCHAE